MSDRRAVFFDVWLQPLARWQPKKFKGNLFEIDGHRFLLFRVGVLCEVLARNHKTIYRWEREEKIPLPLFKVTLSKKSNTQHDFEERWYSEGQIRMMQKHLREVLGDKPRSHRGTTTNHEAFFQAVRRDFYDDLKED